MYDLIIKDMELHWIKNFTWIMWVGEYKGVEQKKRGFSKSNNTMSYNWKKCGSVKFDN